MADLPNPGAFRRVFHVFLFAAVLALLFAVLTACSSRELFHPSPTGKPACGTYIVYSQGKATTHTTPC